MLNFYNFNRTNGVRYATHDILGKKPVSEYVGPSLDGVSYKIIFKAQWGVNPREEMNKLIKLQRDGTLVAVMLGNSTMGMYRWVIKDLSNDFKEIDQNGVAWCIETSIVFEEYV